MAEFNEISPNAQRRRQAAQLGRQPLPADQALTTSGEYYAPKNFNFWYIFGSLALLVLVIQIVTGIFLVMHYKPDAARRSPRSSTSCATCRGAG
jgi:ubiquinol-cytochrome c reductase cytochrome b subunit